MERKIVYSKREWLNDELSPSTGNVIAFDGVVHWGGRTYQKDFSSNIRL